MFYRAHLLVLWLDWHNWTAQSLNYDACVTDKGKKNEQNVAFSKMVFTLQIYWSLFIQDDFFL